MFRIQHRPRPKQNPGAGSAGGPELPRLRRWVEELAVPRHAFVNARANAWVRSQLAAAFEQLGLRVHLQGPHRNVVALPPAPQGPLTLVAAHYDSVPNCPGADDNASGLAVMLECARTLSLRGPNPRLGFVAFNAEEDGLLGSRDFVKNGRASLSCSLGLVHVLEMLGFRGAEGVRQTLPLPFLPKGLERTDYIGVISKGRSNAIVDRALRATSVPELEVRAAKTWGPLYRLLPDLARSDHFPFWLSGVPAVMWTDTGNFRNPHYHRASDLPSTLDYDFLQGVAGLLYELLSAEPAS